MLMLQSFFARMRPDVTKLWNPSVFGHGNAHALAKLYGILANGGSSNGKRLMSPATVESQLQVIISGKCKILRLDTDFGRGYTIMQSPKVRIYYSEFPTLSVIS